MSFRIKKQKQVKKTSGNLSIDFLHQEKLLYFERNKDNYLVQEEMNNYFLDTCHILNEYYNKKDTVKTINPYEDNFQVNENDLELEKKYYEICNITYKFDLKKTNTSVCCDEDMILSPECFYTCYKCGKVGQIYINGSTFKQIQETFITNKFVYKRINYFNDWLKQIQASENSDIPNELITKLKEELCKRNIKDLSKLKPYLIKKILKELKEPKYYENINLIISKLTNRSPLIIPNDVIERMKIMFSSIQEPYEKLKGTRTNFFSYSYILYKFCELLGLKEYLKCLQLLKSRDKILQHDILWKKIIIDMQKKEGEELWRFIPSC